MYEADFFTYFPGTIRTTYRLFQCCRKQGAKQDAVAVTIGGKNKP